MSNNLLIVGNFPSDTGYAWSTICEYFIALGEVFDRNGNRSFICYPEITSIPERLKSSKVQHIKFDFTKCSYRDLFLLIRSLSIKNVYLTDRSLYSLKYLVCRLAGVSNIIVHDRTSGDRDRPGPIKKFLKKAINCYPVISADYALGISGFVTERLINVSCFPRNRTIRIWNGVDINKFSPGEDIFVYEKFNIPPGKKIVFAYSRANRYKGIQVLIDAAAVLKNNETRDDLFFLYCGDGPDLGYFRSLVQKKGLESCFACPGEVRDIDRLLKGVSIVVVPSLWQEGFGLSVIEGMASGKVVIASRVGGIVDIIEDSVNGYLVPPGDVMALAKRIASVADDKNLALRIAAEGRKAVVEKFDIEKQKNKLSGFFEEVCLNDASPGEARNRGEALWRTKK